MAEMKTSVLLPLSQEEGDLLLISSKKVKNNGKSNTANVLQFSWPFLWAKGTEYSKGGLSFDEKLKGTGTGTDGSDEDNNQGHDAMSDNEMSEDEQDCEEVGQPCIVKEDPHRNFPSFTFSEKIKKRL